MKRLKKLPQKNFWLIVVWIAFAAPIFSLLIFFRDNFDKLFEINFPANHNTLVQQSPNINHSISTWFAIEWLENITWDLYIGPFKNFDFYKNILLSAQKNLDIEIYNITLDDIKKIFKQLASNGVDLKIITEKNQYKSYGYSFENLEKSLQTSWLELKNDEGIGITYLHVKSFIFDDKFIIQTANLTYSAFKTNRETFFVSRNKNIRDSLKKIFEKDWNHEKVQEKDVAANLLVCNVNCRNKLETLLKSAQKSIYIWHQNLSDNEIINILKTKKNLDLKIILSDSKENDEAKKLFFDQTKYISSPYIHNKWIIIDNKYLIIWSFNITKNSLDNNREVSIILIDPDLINQYQQAFSLDWNK